jgi:hypothetical protein
MVVDREENTAMDPEFGTIDLTEDGELSTPFMSVDDAPIHNAKILRLIAPGGRVAFSRIPARDLVDSKGRTIDIDGRLADEVELRGGELPTISITSDAGALMLWLVDSRGNNLHSLNPFGMRLLRKAVDGSREVLPNLGKRLGVLNRPFPIQVVRDDVLIVTGTVETDAMGNPVRVIPDAPFTRRPGQTVVMLVPKDARMDGCFIIARNIIRRAVRELHEAMVEATGETRETLDTIQGWGRRREIRKALDKADRVRARLSRNNWNVRIFMPAHLDLGGHLKGDAILTRAGFDMGGVDILSTLDNLKPEMFSSDGKLYLFADAVHDSRSMRWTDRQTMIHHTWILKDRAVGAMRRAHEDVITSLATNSEPQFTRLQRVSVDTEFDDDNINVYARRYALMRAAGVMHMSASAISGISTRWLKKLAPQKRRTKANAEGDVQQAYWLDTYRFPITASEFRTVKSQALANLAGFQLTLEDGFYQSTPIGVVVSNGMSIPLCRMCGGGDFDDHWCVIHGRAMYDTSVKLYGGTVLHFKAGEIFSVFYRLPIGVSSNGIELGTEYMILRPTDVEIEVLERHHPNIPTVDLDTRPKTKAELDWSMFPCPADCEDQEDHDLGHPQWIATKVEFAQTEYDFDVFRAQVHNLARQVAMGGVGGIANMDLVLYQHQIPFPFVCHTEDWVDLMTKSIGHVDDMERWAEILKDRAALVKAASLSGTPIDEYAFARIRSAFGRIHGVVTENGMLHMLRLKHERSRRAFEADRDQLTKNVIAEMQALTANVKIHRVIRSRTGSFPMPPVIEHMTFMHAKLLELMTEQGLRNRDGKVKASASDWDIIASWTHDVLSRAAIKAGRDVDEMLDEEILNALAWVYRYRVGKGEDQMLLNGPFLEVTIRVLQQLRGPEVTDEDVIVL